MCMLAIIIAGVTYIIRVTFVGPLPYIIYNIIYLYNVIKRLGLSFFLFFSPNVLSSNRDRDGVVVTNRGDHDNILSHIHINIYR